MKWRKEANNWNNNPLRRYLTLEERDIYHCLRSLAGDDNGRQGYIERSEGVPYTRMQLSALVDADEMALNQTISKLVELSKIVDDGGILSFPDWLVEQSLPESYNGRKKSPAEREAWQRAMAIKYLESNPDIKGELVGDIIAKMLNDGTIVMTKEGKQNGD